MSLKKKDFYGKEVTDAIKKACDEMGVAQEELDIEIVETGSSGIFGLIRKKAHIRASVREKAPEQESIPRMEPMLSSRENERLSGVDEESEKEIDAVDEDSSEDLDDEGGEDECPTETGEAVSPESLEVIHAELSRLLELMGYPSEIHVGSKGASVHCCITGSFEEALTGQDGKTLDSLQYLLRKIIARKVPGRLRLSIDIGDFRERRQQELAAKAVQLASLVKEDGKTQVIPALNPSERRVVHMALQEDKEIRSRSVGEGLFKKILIYKPGKGKKGGGRKPYGARGHQKAKTNKNDAETKTSEE